MNHFNNESSTVQVDTVISYKLPIDIYTYAYASAELHTYVTVLLEVYYH